MTQFEVTFIVDPVLSDDEIKSAAKNYTDLIANEGGKVVQLDEMGLRQLAYGINKRNTGVYFGLEFQSDAGALIPKMELAMKRDERILRFLTVGLDKYGIKYNDDKRNGKIGKRKDAAAAKKKAEEENN